MHTPFLKLTNLIEYFKFMASSNESLAQYFQFHKPGSDKTTNFPYVDYTKTTTVDASGTQQQIFTSIITPHQQTLIANREIMGPTDLAELATIDSLALTLQFILNSLDLTIAAMEPPTDTPLSQPKNISFSHN